MTRTAPACLGGPEGDPYRGPLDRPIPGPMFGAENLREEGVGAHAGKPDGSDGIRSRWVRPTAAHPAALDLGGAHRPLRRIDRRGLDTI